MVSLTKKKSVILEFLSLNRLSSSSSDFISYEKTEVLYISLVVNYPKR